MPAVQTSNGSHPTVNSQRVRPGSGRHEQIADIQRRRILSATVEVAAECGLANATVTQIVSQAGVSRRTFYEIYTDRDDVLLAAFEDALARAQEHVLRHYDPSQRWCERVRSGLTGMLGFFDAEPGMGRLLVAESLAAGAAVVDRRRWVLGRLVEAVEEGRGETKGNPPALTAEGIVGGALAVIHSRLLLGGKEPVLGLLGPLMSMIVLPYLGPGPARRELERPAPVLDKRLKPPSGDPWRGMGMRVTYRTLCVLSSVGEHPGSSNRQIGEAAGIHDQGQISKLLNRLGQFGLIENAGGGSARGEPNAWRLTRRGREVNSAIGQ